MIQGSRDVSPKGKERAHQEAAPGQNHIADREPLSSWVRVRSRERSVPLPDQDKREADSTRWRRAKAIVPEPIDLTQEDVPTSAQIPGPWKWYPARETRWPNDQLEDHSVEVQCRPRVYTPTVSARSDSGVGV